MEMGKRIEAELVLPEDIIQHIRSFLTEKEAAQTSLLSKSWYNAWLTRPSLDFDPRGFPSVDNFWEFVKKSVQRYEKSNLNIESLRLWIPDNDNPVLVKELIIKGLKMGAIDLDFKINPPNIAFELPDIVLACQNLNRLSVSGCLISIDNGIGNVRCSMLKFLCLDSVLLKGNEIWDIISSCPLIEELSLSRCQFFTCSSNSSFTDNALKLSPRVEFGKQCVDPFYGRLLDPYQFRKLKCLLLCEVKVDPFFFGNMSTTFPCLEDLSLDDCDNYLDVLRIYSPSLECISVKSKHIEEEKRFWAVLDVPNIRKFTFSGLGVPLLWFKTKSIWEESDLCISCDSVPSLIWFLQLNIRLTNLTFSRVYLSLGFLDNFDPIEKIRRDLHKPFVVEDITIDPPPEVLFPALFDVLLHCYRPVFVTQYLAPKSSASWDRNRGFVVFVFERLMQRVRLNCQCDLEQVNVEFYDEALCMWRPLITSEEGRLSCDDKRIRLHLKWTC